VARASWRSIRSRSGDPGGRLQRTGGDAIAGTRTPGLAADGCRARNPRSRCGTYAASRADVHSRRHEKEADGARLARGRRVPTAGDSDAGPNGGLEPGPGPRRPAGRRGGIRHRSPARRAVRGHPRKAPSGATTRGNGMAARGRRTSRRRGRTRATATPWPTTWRGSRVVLFGGYDLSPPISPTPGKWDGSSWSQAAPATSPPVARGSQRSPTTSHGSGSCCSAATWSSEPATRRTPGNGTARAGLWPPRPRARRHAAATRWPTTRSGNARSCSAATTASLSQPDTWEMGRRHLDAALAHERTARAP
jgi:hypothetical protein